MVTLVKNQNNFMKHISIIPLIGGFSIAASNVLDRPPEAIFSYKPFFKNDFLYLKYLEKTLGEIPPYFQLENVDIFDINSFKNLDLCTGVPPCSGLSQANANAGNRSESPVNEWMYNSTEFVLKELRPKIHTFENAPGLYTNTGIKVRERLYNIAKEYGYSILFYKTNSILHGLPQNRIRTYVIYYKGSKAPVFNNVLTHKISLSNYLNTLPKGLKHENDYIVEDPFINNYPLVKFFKYKFDNDWRKVLYECSDHVSGYKYLVRFNLVNEFEEFVNTFEESHDKTKILQNIHHIQNKLKDNKSFRVGYKSISLHKDSINVIYSDTMNKMVHPNEDRIMSIREYLYLMGMPNDFEIANSNDYGKIGQSVPVLTSMDIVSECEATIHHQRELHNQDILMIDNTINKVKKLF